MKRLSTGALMLLIAASFGVSSVVAAPTGPMAQGNTGNTALSTGSSAETSTLAQAMSPDATMTGAPSMSPSPGMDMQPATGAATMAPEMMASPSPAPMMEPSMAPAGVPPADFGNPPAGEVPILFNDHHVYSKPSILRAGRVLSALVRHDTILVPLRSLFEQTGASVSYDSASKTVDVSKPGSDVKVTVGRPEVVINGESRPLDVPPEIYHGSVVVPLRVLAEGMGAYVQWVPDRKVVVVRYVTATPPPPPPSVETTPAPLPPVATPSPTPSPVAKKAELDRYVVGDFLFQPKVYNQFNNGQHGHGAGSSFGIKGAIEFPLFNLPWMVSGDFRDIRYPFLGGNVTSPGDGFVQAYSAGTIRDYSLDSHFGIKITDPHIYVGIGYLYRSVSTGYPSLRGIGFGIEKLPDLDQVISVYGSLYYYPNEKSKGQFTPADSTLQYTLSYHVLRYAIGGVFDPKHSPVFLDFGWEGERDTNKQNEPVNATENGPFVGLGVHF